MWKYVSPLICGYQLQSFRLKMTKNIGYRISSIKPPLSSLEYAPHPTIISTMPPAFNKIHPYGG